MDAQDEPKTETGGQDASYEIDFVTLGMFIIGMIHFISVPFLSFFMSCPV